MRRILDLIPSYRKLRQELATYRHAFDTTAADRDRLAADCERLATRLTTDCERLTADCERYQHAYETTAADRDRLAGEAASVTADRDRLAGECLVYQSAFRTTAADRDRIAVECTGHKSRLEQVLAQKTAHEAALAETETTLWRYTDPLDVGHFRLNLAPFLQPETDPQAHAQLQNWEAMFQRAEFDLLAKSLFEVLHVRIAQQNSPGYFEPFMAYYLASIFAAHGDFARAARYADLIEFDAPPDGGNLLPYDLRLSGRLARFRQEIALRKGQPAVVLVSLMRSASAFLTSTIASTFDIPMLKMSVGEGLRSMVVGHWAAQIARGAAVTHEHFRAIPDNLMPLKKAGVDAIWVQVRDPRDAAFSYVRMFQDNPLIADSPGIPTSSPFTFVCQRLANWISDWLYARDAGGPEINFITYAEVTTDIRATIERMFPGKTLPAIIPQQRNFRRGIGGEWRDLGDEQREQAWHAIPANVKEFLKLEI